MEELKKKIEAPANSLQELMMKIPGYEGYHNREARRDADKIQRTFLADNLKKAKSKMVYLSGPLSRSPNLEHVGEIDRISKIFDKVIDRIRYADYGYAGFFDALKINEEELDKLYEFDGSLANYISVISESLIALESAVDSGEGIKEKLKSTEKLIKELDIKFDEREKLITGVA